MRTGGAGMELLVTFDWKAKQLHHNDVQNSGFGSGDLQWIFMIFVSLNRKMNSDMTPKPKTESLFSDLIASRSKRPLASSLSAGFSPHQHDRVFVENYMATYLQEVL